MDTLSDEASTATNAARAEGNSAASHNAKSNPRLDYAFGVHGPIRDNVLLVDSVDAYGQRVESLIFPVGVHGECALVQNRWHFSGCYSGMPTFDFCHLILHPQMDTLLFSGDLQLERRNEFSPIQRQKRRHLINIVTRHFTKQEVHFCM